LNRYQLAPWLAPLAIVASPASADTAKEIRYANAPDWVLPPPATAAPKPSEAAFRIIYQDTEERITPTGVETYTAYRVKILKPEGLPLGNINVTWVPGTGSATVHYVRIIRDGATIDVLKQAKFKVLERETGLEQSILDGKLTALLQVPGLQTGDELEFAGTVVRSEPAFGDHASGMAQLPVAGLPGDYRYRLLWPTSKKLTLRLAKDLPPAPPSRSGGFMSLVVELRDPPATPDVQGAPARYNLHRTIEYSDYGTWADLSNQMRPLYDAASTLDAKSPLRAEAAKIAAATKDPVERAEAALQLVEGQVRYVFVGLDGGNYLPARADDTWQRRFGDCKAKTVLLLALLRELGIQAEPALLDSKGGDGTDQRLPSPGLFDHVLVRANVNGKNYWLDGTRLGDRHLDMLPPLAAEWALPMSARAELVPIPPVTSPYPQFIDVEDVDASAGFAKDATWTSKHILRGDEAVQINTALATVSPADADRLIKEYWRRQMSDVEAQQVGWSFDQRHSALVLSMKGTGKIDWDGDDESGRSFKLPGAGFYAPDKLQRPSDQDQSAAYSVEYPRFRCFATTVHLPPPTAKFHWTFRSKPVDQRLRGVIYWRAAGLSGRVVRTVMSSQSYLREIPAADAKQVNAKIATFDNYMSSVDETAGSAPAPASPLPFTTEPDWTASPAVCSPPALPLRVVDVQVVKP